MQKKNLWIGLVFVLTGSLHVNTQHVKQDNTLKRWFVGTSLFDILGNSNEENPPSFAQLNLAYRIAGKDIITVAPKAWKHAWSNYIHPFLNL